MVSIETTWPLFTFKIGSISEIKHSSHVTVLWLETALNNTRNEVISREKQMSRSGEPAHTLTSASRPSRKHSETEGGGQLV